MHNNSINRTLIAPVMLSAMFDYPVDFQITVSGIGSRYYMAF